MTMFRKILLGAAASVALSAGSAFAAGGTGHITDFDFSFEGPFGTYDQMQLQRGLQVYTEVCAACHGLKYVPLRTLADDGGPALPENQVRAYAAQFEIFDPEIDDFRPRTRNDHFPESGLENAPDLSLMTKARAGFSGPYGLGINQLMNGIGGAEYLASVLSHYEENPACAPDGIDGFYYNTAFTKGSVPESCKDEHGASTVPGSWIAMPEPLADDLVTYADGTPATVEQMSEDVAAFLMWAAEPKMNARKEAGFTAVLFLGVLAVLLYLTNKRLWAGIKGRRAA